MMKLKPLCFGCTTMMTPPIAVSFLDHIDHWGEPLMLLSTAIAWPIASLVASTQLADKIFFGLIFVGCAVWLALLILPLFVHRIQKPWFYIFQFVYSSLNAWLGIVLIGTKHC